MVGDKEFGLIQDRQLLLPLVSLNDDLTKENRAVRPGQMMPPPITGRMSELQALTL